MLISVSASVIMSALAQDKPDPQMDRSDYPHQDMAQSSANRLNGAAKASELIGMTVKNYQGEKLAKVDDLAVDVEAGRIVQVILSTGGVLGMGSTLTAVPPGAVHHDVANKVLHLDASKEKLNAAPKFDAAKWEDCTESNRVTEVYDYYGQQPYFVGGQDEYWTTNSDGSLARTLPRNMDGTINTTGARTMDTARNKEMAGQSEILSNTTAMDSVITTRNPHGASAQRGSSLSSSLGYIQKGSKLLGTSVKNLQNEKLGKVQNFIVDLSSGRIVVVIISSGGYLGMGNELSAVPPNSLEYNAEHDVFQLDTSKEMLANAPHFQANQWPDLSQPSYAGSVYHAYKVEPYFNPDQSAASDNTARNVRDRNNSTLTPLDQGTSQADIDTTTQIRKAIVATQGMSTNAKNVKIITIDGRVTLRGPVNSAEEKARSVRLQAGSRTLAMWTISWKCRSPPAAINSVN